MSDFTSYSLRSRPTETALEHLQLGEEPAALLPEARRERDRAHGAAVRARWQQVARDWAGPPRRETDKASSTTVPAFCLALRLESEKGEGFPGTADTKRDSRKNGKPII